MNSSRSIIRNLATPKWPCIALVLSSLGTSIATEAPLLGQEGDESDLGWSDQAEVSLFASTGNAEVHTISLRNTTKRSWSESSFELAAGAVRSETTSTTRVAVGDPLSFVITETSDSQLTAENFYLRSRYDRTLLENLVWFAGLGWERNEFTGISNRVTVFGGVGRIWFDSESARLHTDYGLTYTDQEDVSGDSSGFAGLRLSYDYERRLNANTTFASGLILDENLDETADYRADFSNSLGVSMSDRLALKVNLQLLYDNAPALGEVALVGIDGLPTGNTVLTPLDELDSILTVSLVADF